MREKRGREGEEDERDEEEDDGSLAVERRRRKRRQGPHLNGAARRMKTWNSNRK